MKCKSIKPYIKKSMKISRTISTNIKHYFDEDRKQALRLKPRLPTKI